MASSMERWRSSPGQHGDRRWRWLALWPPRGLGWELASRSGDIWACPTLRRPCDVRDESQLRA